MNVSSGGLGAVAASMARANWGSRLGFVPSLGGRAALPGPAAFSLPR